MNSKVAKNTYLVAGYKSWNRRIFEETISKYPGQWHFIGKQEQLTVEEVSLIDPRAPEALRAVARRWGSVAGLEAAEAFQLIRSVR